MESVTIYIEKAEQRQLLVEFLQHIDFVSLKPSKASLRKKPTRHNIFDSAGMWAKREIDQKTIREKAWKRS